MWIPPQWRLAFPAVTAVVIVLAVLLAWSATAGLIWVAALSGGLIIGLIVSIAWTMVALLPMFAMLYVAAALVLVILLGVISASMAAAALVVALVALAAWHFGYIVPVEARHAAEIVSELRSLGGSGEAGRALIVHHPGLSGLHTRHHEALAEGMIAAGWQVDMATASAAAPVDLAPYDLLVAGCPSYNFRPAAPLTRYFQRVGDLGGKPVLIVVSGGGLTEPATRRLYGMVGKARGRVVRTVEIWRSRPNRERHGVDDPFVAMRKIGQSLDITAA